MVEDDVNSRVVVGMSGGVDSSTAAVLLREQGFDVHGVMMVLHENGQGMDKNAEAVNKARSVAEKLGIPFEIIDLRAEFRKQVLAYFIQAHEQGITPNPCFICNRQIKWGLLMEQTRRRGFNWLASGHYARTYRRPDGKVELFRARDLQKDQSYVLAGLNQEQLAHAVFPLGELMKTQTKEIAHRYDLDFHDVKESQDLCFLEGMSQEEYLNKHAPHLFEPGDIQTTDGVLIGRHNGLANYTIGQRKGLGAGQKEPLFVIRKEINTNKLIVGGRSFLGKREISVANPNWITGEAPEFPVGFDIKIRYRSNLLKGILNCQEDTGCDIIFQEPVRDPTPGQYAVFYQGDRVLGSAVIVENILGVRA